MSVMAETKYQDINDFLKHSAQTSTQLVNSEPVPIPYLLDPLIIKGNYHLLTGPIGNMKSYFSLWLGSQLAESGQNVLFVDKENSLLMTESRARKMNLTDSENFIYWCERAGMSRDQAPPDFKQGLHFYKKVIELWDNPVLIFDTLNRFAPGVDENSVKDTTFITDSLMSLRNHDDGATIIALHQVGKPSERGYQNYRGSSEIGGGADVGLSIKDFAQNAQGASFRINCWKTRWLPFSDLTIVFDSYSGKFHPLPDFLTTVRYYDLRSSLTKYLKECPEVRGEELKEAMTTKAWGKYKVKETEWMLENREEYWLRAKDGNSFVYKNLPRMKG